MVSTMFLHPPRSEGGGGEAARTAAGAHVPGPRGRVDLHQEPAYIHLQGLRIHTVTGT